MAIITLLKVLLKKRKPETKEGTKKGKLRIKIKPQVGSWWEAVVAQAVEDATLNYKGWSCDCSLAHCSETNVFEEFVNTIKDNDEKQDT